MLMLCIYWSDVNDGVIAAQAAPAEWIWSRDDDDTGPAMRQRESSERLVRRFEDPLREIKAID
jgi:hypothetical protein